MTYSNEQMMAALKVPRPTTAPVFKTAFIIATVGFILVALSMALFVLYYELWIGQVSNGAHGSADFSLLGRLIRISSYAQGIGSVMMVLSIVVMIHGLRIQDDLSGSKAALYSALNRAKWVALLSLMLYALSTVVEIAIGETSPDLSTDASFKVTRLISYSSFAAFVFLAALPVIVAHALNKPST